MSPNLTTQVCKKCGQEFPLTNEFWPKSNRRKCGFLNSCKLCRNKENRASYIRNRLSVSESRKRKRQLDPDRFNSYSRTSYNRHRVKVLTRCAEYRKNNAEKEKKRHEIYRINNPEKTRLSDRKYQQANPDKVKAYGRRYLDKHPSIVRVKNSRRRARKMAAEGSHTKEDIKSLYEIQKGRCFHCDTDLTITGYHADHWIPLSRGGRDYIENIRLLCPHCNVTKWNKLPCEWDARYCD